MVIEDLFSPVKPSPKTENEITKMQIAAPVDRIAAFVGEMPLFIPILSVLLSPFRHDISVAELTGSEVQIAFAIFGIVMTTCLTLVAYQTIFLYLFGATPGKYFVGLRVVSVFDQSKPSLVMCLLRSLSICLEILLLGFPWLASLSHPQRRVLHDRLSDTYVKTLDPKKAVVAPVMLERQFAKNFQAPGWALFLLALIFGLNYMSAERKNLGVLKEFEGADKLCSQVSAAQKDWRSTDDARPSRIAIALALFESQNIDEICLEKEALFSLWNNQDKDMGYLAQAISNMNDEKFFNQYLDKVCLTNKDGDACKFATDLEKEQGPTTFETRLPAAVEYVELKPEEITMKTDFMKLHVERQLHDNNQLADAMKLIDKISTNSAFADFLDLERLKIMWEMDRMAEARAVFQSSMMHVSGAGRLQLSSWMCSAEMLNGCTDRGKNACAQFVANYDELTSSTQPEPVELNYIRAQKCVSGENMDYVEIGNKISSDRSHDYLSAIELVSDHKFGPAREIFRQIADQTDSDEFQAQAIVDLVALSQNKVELDYFFEEFLSKSEHQADPKFAYELFKKYSALGDFEHFASVGENLLRIFPYKTSLYAKLSSEALKHKNYKFAEKIQSEFKRMRPEIKSFTAESGDL